MKTLQTIQKTCKVFYVLAKVAMSLSFVWAGLNLIGVICCLVWHYTGGIPGGYIEEILTENGGVIKAIGVLLSDIVFGVTDGILFCFTSLYLKQELADGTPFTEKGAKQVLNLGIRTILLPIIAIVLYGIIYACFDLSQNEKFSNGESVILGVALILVSFVLRHGAELRKENENEKAQNK